MRSTLLRVAASAASAVCVFAQQFVYPAKGQSKDQQ